MNPRLITATVALAATLGLGARSHAALSASATISLVNQPTATTYNYNISLHNTGTTPIGTFWFAWIPGQDYMATAPITITNPSTWASTVTGGGGSNGYAILWTAGTTIPAGGTLSTFSFTSADAPASFNGNSVFYPTTPVGTSFVYSGGPFSDSGYQFVVTQAAATPEPASLSLLAIGGLAAVRRRR